MSFVIPITFFSYFRDPAFFSRNRFFSHTHTSYTKEKEKTDVHKDHWTIITTKNKISTIKIIMRRFHKSTVAFTIPFEFQYKIFVYFIVKPILLTYSLTHIHTFQAQHENKWWLNSRVFHVCHVHSLCSVIIPYYSYFFLFGVLCV